MPEAGFADAMSAAVCAYIASKAAVFDGDDDLSSVTIVIRVGVRSGHRLPARVFHRTESEGGDVIPTTAPRARAAS